MIMLIFLLGIFVPILFGVIAWKKYDTYFPPKEPDEGGLVHYLKKLMAIFLIVLLMMYAIFLLI